MAKKRGINWNEVSFLQSGKHRKTILRMLDTPKTPTQLRKESNLHFNTVSRALIELEKHGFVKCLTPNQKLCRFYTITPKAKDVLKNCIK